MSSRLWLFQSVYQSFEFLFSVVEMWRDAKPVLDCGQNELLCFQLRMTSSQIIQFYYDDPGAVVIRTRCDAMKPLLIDELHQMLSQCTNPVADVKMSNISYEINR